MWRRQRAKLHLKEHLDIFLGNSQREREKSKAALRKQFLLWMNWMCYSGTSNLRDVLLRLVEFLCEVLGRRLAGYLDKGHLFPVACQVARRLAHAVVVVPLDEEV